MNSWIWRTTYRSHLQEWRFLKMAPIDCPETSVRTYRYSLHNSPEERRSLQLRKKQNFVTRMFCFELYDSQYDKGGYNIMCWLYRGSGLISILRSPSPSTIPHRRTPDIPGPSAATLRSDVTEAHHSLGPIAGRSLD
jgi:hypothetical protein